MNPFATPAEIVAYDRPVDMRCGIDRLQQLVEAGLGRSPADGTLFVFVSRSRRMVKMLRYDGGAWCMWHVRPARGRVRWEFGDAASRELTRLGLLCLLDCPSAGESGMVGGKVI